MTSSAMAIKSQLETMTAEFERLFSETPAVYRAPGRVNLIGEHTDYNDGFVMPAAIDFFTWVAIAANSQPVIRAHSVQFHETVTLELAALAGPPTGHWSDFIRGVAAGLIAAGTKLSGCDLLVDGQVPLGSGLSSSAALEVATATALLGISGQKLSQLDLVKICQKAEHNFVGTRCGIMDQFISQFGEAGHALMLDCRSLEFRSLPIPNGVRIVICNSMVKHALAAGEYNRRREDCEGGVEALRAFLPGIRALRDVSLEQLERHRESMPERVYRRCRHVIAENDRVQQAADALTRGDLVRFGVLMNDSHESLRRDYEVSCRELDALVEAARGCNGVYGARMTGGGFGGCTVNLVRADGVDSFRDQVRADYAKTTGLNAEVYVTSAAQGAGEVAQ
jgi:galactokinase